jgi:hypothetical protein
VNRIRIDAEDGSAFETGEHSGHTASRSPARARR